MKRTYYYPKSLNTTQLISDRSYYRIEPLINNRLQTAPQFIERLDLEATLEGHYGCVNCLEWSEDGKLLASASDDYLVMIWDPFKHCRKMVIQTPHRNNIFSVKFLPQSGDSKLVTGAGDSRICLFDINKPTTKNPIWSCQCHLLRVKRLATTTESPFMFWSSGEDGYVLQFDIREPHTCLQGCKVVLLDLCHQISRNTEIKCIAINPRRPELLAVGTNDPYVRVYDRRMIPLSNVMRENRAQFNRTDEDDIDNVSKNCVTYFCPGHFKRHIRSNAHHKAITYVAFSPDGTELLVNMGCEQIYLYDLNNAKEPVFMELPPRSIKTDGSVKDKTKKNGTLEVEALKRNGNQSLKNEEFLPAITQYTTAINLMTDHSVLYLNRATAYMRRNWYGDVYAALRDCNKALELDPHYVKAHFRLARALLELGYVTESKECLNELKLRFPKLANDNGVKMLMKDISSATEEDKTNGTDRILLNYTEKEIQLRASAKDYKEWFVGHCNSMTDIKEANFFGKDGKYIVAGSDDGHFFLWERPSNMIKSIYKADSTSVNCVQPHPNICFMATCGLDHVIRLWSPRPDEESLEQNNSNCRINFFDSAVSANQARMQTDPFEVAEQRMCRTS